MKGELPKSSIVNTYIEDQLKTFNNNYYCDLFGQLTLTSTWWFDLTSLLTSHFRPPTAGFLREFNATQRSP